MTEPQIRSFLTSDDYPIHVTVWPTGQPARGRLVILHGVQSHGGWYHRLGRTLAEAGFETHFPDRRGSGANRRERGHSPSPGRLIDDLAEYLQALRVAPDPSPIGLAGISWGGKLAVIAAGRHADKVDALALICPGLHPRVDVSLLERAGIAWALFTGQAAKKTFSIPLNDPALFTASPEGQAFIASDPLSLRVATAGLMASSAWIDRWVARIPPQVRQPALLMLAGQDRIVDNAKTRQYFERLASTSRQVIEYPEGHHTLEFEPDPSRYALDLAAWLNANLPCRG